MRRLLLLLLVGSSWFAGSSPAQWEKARDYALKAGGSGLIVHHGEAVLSWGDQEQLYDLKSTSKSFGATALGLALADGKLSLETKAADCIPGFGLPPADNPATWLSEVTLFHLATQTAGFVKPGGFERIAFRPGARWDYSDGGPNWLADCITLTYGRDVEDLMFERVFEPIGITRSDLRWRRNHYRPEEIDGIPRREFGSGVHANVGAMALLGRLYLNEGRWDGVQILPREFVEQARRPQSELVGLEVVHEDEYPEASGHYGLLWWNNADGALSGVPRDAYWSWGLHDSLIVVVPSLDLVAARAGREGFDRGWGAGYARLAGFLRPIVNATGAPYSPSPVIREMKWAPTDAIARKAEGSDNWPLTWADDDAQYTAYGDGWGFEPKTPIKLSLGLAKILGEPPDFAGINIRSPSGERIGQGPAGEKASGILAVDGVLYLWVRNAGNSQLLWSEDRGVSWTPADWRFTESFGAPTFLNFGKNYENARDRHVYVYSHDDDSAYRSADRQVLARVPVERVRRRGAYEFFAGLDGSGNPVWTQDIAGRAAVFANPGRAYRSGVSYNAGVGRYLWCQVIPGPDTRFEGGFGVYDAPEPWGPWTTAFYTNAWDVGPGETCSFPTKWMSPDGKTVQMVFSGDDFFSVRKAVMDASPE